MGCNKIRGTKHPWVPNLPPRESPQKLFAPQDAFPLAATGGQQSRVSAPRSRSPASPAPPAAQVAQSLGILRRKPVPNPCLRSAPLRAIASGGLTRGDGRPEAKPRVRNGGWGGVGTEKSAKVEFQLFLGSIPLGGPLKAADFLSKNVARLFISPKWKAREGCGASVPGDGRTPRARGKVKRGN